jgi:hypothetical protein
MVIVPDGDADAVVLREARARQAYVVSKDRFVDYRIEHPWIDDNETDFLAWVPDPDNLVRIVPRLMGRHTGFSVSRAAEKAMLKNAACCDVATTASGSSRTSSKTGTAA